MKNLIIIAMLLVVTGIMTGCKSTSQTTPVSPLLVQAKLDRTDYSVLKKVKGESYTESYLAGLVQIVDGKTILFWCIKDFDEEYAGIPGIMSSPLAALPMLGPSTSTRAYYKALQKSPEADMVIPKSCVYKQRIGFPLIYSKETVVYTGKAIKIKSDDELKK